MGKAKSSRNSKNFQSFFRSMEKSGIKSEFKENLKNMQIFSEASAADPRIKLCPRLAGVGPQRDYSIRPAWPAGGLGLFAATGASVREISPLVRRAVYAFIPRFCDRLHLPSRPRTSRQWWRWRGRNRRRSPPCRTRPTVRSSRLGRGLSRQMPRRLNTFPSAPMMRTLMSVFGMAVSFPFISFSARCL